ncbi:LIN1-like protein [Colletotrichum orbiculare MAFF 240422]|uniref:LIN1-like protein n=1 Tax=Colletotrichum orbiculare (strain 104-T / ATCC 96160 / CBS 514.97 / LARS 414 / MAFF 240422) TaxID=1213857 RepID=N4VKV2_COLOR|nr:LIN1-like protein [Colletotrichum orbiculare MAFF 240422]
MSSRHSAARPKRAGETFARTHHHDGDDDGHDPKKLKFDVRNPSALAPDAPEEDAILDADVIGGGGGATKRGAVNLDGYDSDSDNERNFKGRAAERSRGKKGVDANFFDQLDNYDAKGDGPKGGAVNEDDEDEDMFAADDDDEQQGKAAQETVKDSNGKKDKAVRFLDDTQIEGQELQSKSGGQVRLDDEESSDDEEDKDLAIQEEGIDEEVGLGGLKRNAPKVEAFNMKEEQEEGRFDEDGNYIRKAVDPNAVHDKWLEGLSKKDMKKAAEAHERREAEARRLRMENDDILTTDLLKALILRLDKGETALEALARLAKGQPKQKKVPKWKLKKQSKGAEDMEVDQEKELSPEQAKRKEDIEAITDAADKLLSRDHAEIYDEEREMLVREWQRETGEQWVEPKEETAQDNAARMWEFRWTDGRDGAEKQGPYDGPTMKAWQDAGYFGEGVEFRPAGEDGWSRVATFV